MQEIGTVLYRIRSHERLEVEGAFHAQEPSNDTCQPPAALGRGLSAGRLQYDSWRGQRHIRRRPRDNEKRQREYVGTGTEEASARNTRIRTEWPKRRAGNWVAITAKATAALAVEWHKGHANLRAKRAKPSSVDFDTSE